MRSFFSRRPATTAPKNEADIEQTVLFPLSDLPTDLLPLILSFADNKSLIRCMQVSHVLRELARKEFRVKNMSEFTRQLQLDDTEIFAIPLHITRAEEITQYLNFISFFISANRESTSLMEVAKLILLIRECMAFLNLAELANFHLPREEEITYYKMTMRGAAVSYSKLTLMPVREKDKLQNTLDEFREDFTAIFTNPVNEKILLKDLQDAKKETLTFLHSDPDAKLPISLFRQFNDCLDDINKLNTAHQPIKRFA